MQDLKVVGSELGALIVANQNEEEFRLIVDDSFHVHLRRAKPVGPVTGAAVKISPREVQAHIRGGLSAEDVAAVTGASLEYVQRFEGPVIAEREHIVGTALGVAVLPTTDGTSDDTDATFGSVIRARLERLGATGERWTSWKDAEGGWIVKLAFTADQVEHDARWAFEPKKLALAPIGSEATTLSRQGDMPAGLIPRLRAVDLNDSGPDTSRFDSGAFTIDNDLTDGLRGDALGEAKDGLRSATPEVFRAPEGSTLTETPFGRGTSSKAATQAAINREAEVSSQPNQTADLLEALRKRRGERESAPTVDDEPGTLTPVTPHTRQTPQTGSVFGAGVFDTAEFEAAREQRAAEPEEPAQPTNGKAQRKGRASMPSWDEIVFGAKSDDDPV
ncbi:septation protein SepH [Plantibacter sp. Mn2098]|uniref:septation protein SepH n=1 Tax=Plantibacter sp. Mn2098 TaxID=3395266 RepID=UPI003BC2874C